MTNKPQPDTHLLVLPLGAAAHGSSPTSCAGSLSQCEHNRPGTWFAARDCNSPAELVAKYGDVQIHWAYANSLGQARSRSDSREGARWGWAGYLEQARIRELAREVDIKFTDSAGTERVIPVPADAWVGYVDGKALTWFSGQGQADTALRYGEVDSVQPASDIANMREPA